MTWHEYNLLQNDIDNETNNRIAANVLIHDDIDNETNNRIAADTLLQLNLDQLATTITSNDEDIAQHLTFITNNYNDIQSIELKNQDITRSDYEFQIENNLQLYTADPTKPIELRFLRGTSNDQYADYKIKSSLGDLSFENQNNEYFKLTTSGGIKYNQLNQNKLLYLDSNKQLTSSTISNSSLDIIVNSFPQIENKTSGIEYDSSIDMTNINNLEVERLMVNPPAHNLYSTTLSKDWLYLYHNTFNASIGDNPGGECGILFGNNSGGGMLKWNPYISIVKDTNSSSSSSLLMNFGIAFNLNTPSETGDNESFTTKMSLRPATGALGIGVIPSDTDTYKLRVGGDAIIDNILQAEEIIVSSATNSILRLQESQSLGFEIRYDPSPNIFHITRDNGGTKFDCISIARSTGDIQFPEISNSDNGNLLYLDSNNALKSSELWYNSSTQVFETNKPIQINSATQGIKLDGGSVGSYTTISRLYGTQYYNADNSERSYYKDDGFKITSDNGDTLQLSTPGGGYGFIFNADSNRFDLYSESDSSKFNINQIYWNLH